ncbi:hypothetical protein B296_00006818 [Ensete ventricosum]|uniref:Uncharacterized protein n=1 Tax=Ensete ventricosum TaxID=4639 RepID=A0A426ZKG5_ENSVE|nr:hypothetical protein B296_00006818 [Ensete ventricosum]
MHTSYPHTPLKKAKDREHGKGIPQLTKAFTNPDLDHKLELSNQSQKEEGQLSHEVLVDEHEVMSRHSDIAAAVETAKPLLGG